MIPTEQWHPTTAIYDLGIVSCASGGRSEGQQRWFQRTVYATHMKVSETQAFDGGHVKTLGNGRHRQCPSAAHTCLTWHCFFFCFLFTRQCVQNNCEQTKNCHRTDSVEDEWRSPTALELLACISCAGRAMEIASIRPSAAHYGEPNL